MANLRRQHHLQYIYNHINQQASAKKNDPFKGSMGHGKSGCIDQPKQHHAWVQRIDDESRDECFCNGFFPKFNQRYIFIFSKIDFLEKEGINA